MSVLFGRAPLFDAHANPAAYRLTTVDGSVDGLLDTVLSSDVLGIARGLPLLLPVATAQLDRVVNSRASGLFWVEPLEDRLDDLALQRWTAARNHLGGIVIRDARTAPDHVKLRDAATAGRIHTDGLAVDDIRERRLGFGGEVLTIATGVHTAELHGTCRAIGLDLVGGRYLDDVRPDPSRTATGDRLTLLQLTATLQDEKPPLTDVTRLIERSPTLSYEVMRWINSAFIGLKHEVDDLRRAVGLLGPGRITQVVSLLLARELTDRPMELYRTALVRARMCEAIAVQTGDPRQASYITGLFSMLEAMLEVPLDDALRQLPLSEDVTSALLRHDGRLGQVLHAAKLYESSAFDEPVLAAFDAGVLSAAYLDAIGYADEILMVAGAVDVAA